MKIETQVFSQYWHRVTAGECRADIHLLDDGPIIVWRKGFYSATVEELEAICAAAREMK